MAAPQAPWPGRGTRTETPSRDTRSPGRRPGIVVATIADEAVGAWPTKAVAAVVPQVAAKRVLKVSDSPMSCRRLERRISNPPSLVCLHTVSAGTSPFLEHSERKPGSREEAMEVLDATRSGPGWQAGSRDVS